MVGGKAAYRWFLRSMLDDAELKLHGSCLCENVEDSDRRLIIVVVVVCS